ncbi:MAG TPA: right-handed parallel beta-helix repeat-containing protein [Candidatus Sulfotelmatobacter sp.]|jgi:parallel beta-helix repeat protein|nr:right-handed parallel beta-helix repeat-containing protein [Candidatus Sulfotelmatobacter sp.]
MKAKFFQYSKCALLCLVVVLLPHPRMIASASQLVVDDDKAECPHAGFTHIQDAINSAAAGDRIRICKGTYAEQLTIQKSLTLDADSGAILMPGVMHQNTVSLFDSAPIAAAILVQNASNVTVRGLIVDGANNGISACSPDLEGITFQNASGSIERAAVRNFKLGSGLEGCQSGTGIFVQSGGGTISNVEIEDCTIHDYQKNGITADEVGTNASIRHNVVTGLGPTTGAAQNGIQIGFGAEGVIERNLVTNNIWSPCSVAATCQFVATNILVTQSDGVEISRNRAGISQVAIFVAGNNASVLRNETFAAFVFDGVRIEGNQARVRDNQVFNGAEAGIFLLGNNNVVRENVITEAPIGILKDTSSMGDLIAANLFFDTPIKVQDPPSAGLAKALQPKR